MRQAFLLFILLLFCKFSFGQYKIDPDLKAQYREQFKRLPEEVKNDSDTDFKDNLGILFDVEIDTLNKNDFEPIDTSLKLFSINPETGEEEPLATNRNDEETVSMEHPLWLNCECKFKGDILEIHSGIGSFSGFAVNIRLAGDRASAFYTEYESSGKVFRMTLTDKKVSDFISPATIHDLTIDRKPTKGLKEIYGRISVASNSYYVYVNAWNFKHGYIHQRVRLQFYFRCHIPEPH